jgi:hypothetical protein
MGTDTSITGCWEQVSDLFENCYRTEDMFGDYLPVIYGKGMFKNCTTLEKIPDEESLTFSSQDVEGYFRYQMYYGCTNLKNTSKEYMPETVTSISYNFRAGIYSGCSSLLESLDEIDMPNVTSIGTSYRKEMYYQCAKLTKAGKEGTLGASNILGDFRYSQYSGCPLLENAPDEAELPFATSLGEGYRSYQYISCLSLSNIAKEAYYPLLTSIGDKYRIGQYANNSQMPTLVAPEDRNKLVNHPLGANRPRELQFSYTGFTDTTPVIGGGRVNYVDGSPVVPGSSDAHTSIYGY